MTDDQIDITVRLRNAVQAARDSRTVAGGIKGIGTSADAAKRSVAGLGPAVDRATSIADRGMSRLARSVRYPALALGGLGVAGVKWGLGFNASVESSRLRFKLFTDDIDGLTKSVQHIDLNSQFNFADLADSAAMLGNSGIKDVAPMLQAAANAAAAGGKGAQGLNSIVIALSQIASKGRLSQEEINQLTEAGAPGVMKTIADGFGLSAKQLQNLGNEGLSSKKALKLLTDEWTSGKMAKAASEQTKTLGGQWQLFTGNAQKAAGALTSGLAGDLEHEVLPAANRAAQGIQKIFEDQDLTAAQKFRRVRAVIDRELGPVAEHLKDNIEAAHIPEALGDVIGKAVPFMANAAADAAPHVAEAFATAWLHSGPWTKLISALYLGGKVRQIGRGLGVGGRGGGLGRGLLGKASPVPVYVTNPGFGAPGLPGSPSGTGGGGGKSFIKKVLPFAGAAGGALGAELLFTDFINSQPSQRPLFSRLSEGDQHDIQLADRYNVGRGANGGGGGQGVYRRASQRNGLFGQVRDTANHTPSLINQIETTTNVMLDGRKVAQSVTRQSSRSKARRAGG